MAQRKGLHFPTNPPKVRIWETNHFFFSRSHSSKNHHYIITLKILGRTHISLNLQFIKKSCTLLVMKWYLFFILTKGSHHRQVAALVPDEKLHALIINAGFFFQNKRRHLSSGTSAAIWQMMAPHCQMFSTNIHQNQTYID